MFRLRLLSATVCAFVGLAACTTDTQGGDQTGLPGASSGGTSSGGTSSGGTSNGGTSNGGFGLEADQELGVQLDETPMPTGQTVMLTSGELSVGKDLIRKVKITNKGSTGVLRLTKIELLYKKAAETEDPPAFTCVVPGETETPCDKATFPDIVPAGQQGTTAVTVHVKYRKYDDTKRNANLRIASNDSKKKDPHSTVFLTTASAPKLTIQPGELDFGFVPSGSKVADTKLINVGTGDLIINAIDLSSLPKDLFKFVIDGKEHVTGGTVTLDPTLTVKPSGSLDVKLVYFASDDKAFKGDVLLVTNDQTVNEGGAGWKRIPVKVNSTGPCLVVSPKQMVFGATAVGKSTELPLTLKSCGDQEVEISALTFDLPGGAGPFAIDWSKVAATGGKEPTAAAPLKVAINGQAVVPVVFTPTENSKIDPTSKNPVPFKAGLTATANTAAGKHKASLEGVGASGDCPTGIITIAEGDAVVPQTVLHLDGKQSFSNGSSISKYQWEVDQPKGSVGLFQPNNKMQTVQFQPNVAGKYTFRLHVWDQSGKQSCFPAEKVVNVLPDQAIHVELLWNTPGDKDQTDSGPGAGSDLDLHFAHQWAAGQDFDSDGKPDPWFAGQYDCFWYNCGNGNAVQWGSYDLNVDDDPRLDRDDTDGAGPENLNLTLPEDGRIYSVGVHYFNDFGKGPSTATVRIYVYGQLQWEKTSPALSKNDLWYAATIDWPQAEISSPDKEIKDKKPFVTKNYPAPPLD